MKITITDEQIESIEVDPNTWRLRKVILKYFINPLQYYDWLLLADSKYWDGQRA